MTMRFLLSCLILLAGSSSLLAQSETAESTAKPGALPLGVVTEEPESGPFVKTDAGYMVPYKTTIPGTDVVFEMVPIAGGKFTMGSPDDEADRGDDEGPRFEVTVEPFWMGKYEVTWGEYWRFMAMDKVFKALNRDGVRKTLDKFQIDAVTAPSPLYDESFTYYEGEEYNQPAATISQYAAKQYTKWLSLTSGEYYRLPFESEWEYACRAGTQTAYYFGDDADQLEEHGWFVDNADEERHYVGELKPNPWGLYDMHGNVAEWVLDGHNEDGYTQVKEGASVGVEASYSQPTEVYSRVVRGGSFNSEAAQCRSAARIVSTEDWKYEDPNFPKSPWWFTDYPATGVGFRLLRPLNAPETLEEKNKFWKADVSELEDNALARIKSNGKGALGTVDETLPEQMEKLPEADK